MYDTLDDADAGAIVPIERQNVVGHGTRDQLHPSPNAQFALFQLILNHLCPAETVVRPPDFWLDDGITDSDTRRQIYYVAREWPDRSTVWPVWASTPPKQPSKYSCVGCSSS